MRKILVAIEQSGGVLDDSAWELASLAHSLGGEDCRAAAVLFGRDLSGQAGLLTPWFDDVYLFDDPSLEEADGEARNALLVPLIERERPLLTLIPHSNNGMDLAPSLSIRVGTPFIPDCISLDLKEDGLSAVRTVYSGKVHARVTAAASENGYIATVRPGAYPAAENPPERGGTIHKETVPDGIVSKRRFVETVPPEPGAVDITQSEILVAVGRGIDEEENMEIIESLAKTIGADVACSRPVVDKKWLAKSRQVGTSGVTVKPKIYIAIGISGSFQHMGGIKGGPFLAAINKDPAAPIFGVADVGIVGDLFDLVPLMDEKIQELKS